MIKRIFDFTFALLFLTLFLPLFLLISILIAFSSRGPVFYLQDRVGLNGKDFKIFKFRSMYLDSDGKTLITIGNRDPRITGIGYFLRKYKLDELPQLINVLIGNMSLVGPRPEVRKYVMHYNSKQLEVLKVKPGITDYASLEYSNENEILSKSENPEKEYLETIMPAKLNLSLKYIEKKDLLTDLKIIFLTIVKVSGLDKKN